MYILLAKKNANAPDCDNEMCILCLAEVYSGDYKSTAFVLPILNSLKTNRSQST